MFKCKLSPNFFLGFNENKNFGAHSPNVESFSSFPLVKNRIIQENSCSMSSKNSEKSVYHEQSLELVVNSCETSQLIIQRPSVNFISLQKNHDSQLINQVDTDSRFLNE